MAKRRTPWLTQPSNFKPFFSYATGLPRTAASKKGSAPPPSDKDKVTTLAVGEEGTGTPPPPGKTTPAIGEEGAGDVPTTTIAKGEEGK